MTSFGRNRQYLPYAKFKLLEKCRNSEHGWSKFNSLVHSMIHGSEFGIKIPKEIVDYQQMKKMNPFLPKSDIHENTINQIRFAYMRTVDGIFMNMIYNSENTKFYYEKNDKIIAEKPMCIRGQWMNVKLVFRIFNGRRNKKYHCSIITCYDKKKCV